MAKSVTVPHGRVREYSPPHPERTARRELGGSNINSPTWGMVEFKEWPNRESMLTTIRMQGQRAPKSDDWRAILPVSAESGWKREQHLGTGQYTLWVRLTKAGQAVASPVAVGSHEKVLKASRLLRDVRIKWEVLPAGHKPAGATTIVSRAAPGQLRRMGLR